MKLYAKTAFKRWHLAVTKAVMPGPPYSPTLPVTPRSVFGDDLWEEPIENLPAGAKHCRWYNFYGHCLTRENGSQSLQPSHSMLLLQLKEAMIGVKYHHHALNAHFKRAQVKKPRTWRRDLQGLRRIFVGASRQGLTDIRHLTQEHVDEILDELKITDGGRVIFGIHLDQLQHLSDKGLLSGTAKMARSEVNHRERVIDTTLPKGVEPLTDAQIQQTVNVSLFYIDHAAEIAYAITKLNKAPHSERSIRDWCKRSLPCQSRFESANLKNQLVLLVQVSAANLIGYHIGTRPSETLSMQTDCVQTTYNSPELNLSRMEIAFQTFKAIKQIGGLARTVGVSEYIKNVVNGLEAVMTAAGAVSENLFSNPSQDHEYNDNQWLAKQVRFCKLHKFDFTFSGTSWRKSLVSVLISAFDNPLEEIGTLTNHKYTGTTAAYGQAPFILNELNEGYIQVVRKRYRTLFESSLAFGGEGLGGLQGLEIERRLAQLFKTDLTEYDIEMTMDEFIDDLLSKGIVPMLVKPGMFCVKGPRSPGYCSRASGDTQPDPSKCSAACHFQVQLEEAKRTLVWEINNLVASLSPNLPAMRLDYWLNDILDRVKAWPALVPVLSEIVATNKELAGWFGKKLENVNVPTA